MEQQGEGRPLRLQVAGALRTFCCHRATLSRTHHPNSLAAVDECAAAAAPRVEVDVRFLSDNGMLVFHDEALDRETNGKGAVDVLERATARTLRYRGDSSGLCFLEEVVDSLASSPATLQVDLKHMGAISAGRVAALAKVLEPLGERVLVGSQAHWNIRRLADTGLPVAFDPTLHWHRRCNETAPAVEGPRRMGIPGLWDDAPLAHVPDVPFGEYVAARIEDLVAIAPAIEWMVDFRTILWLRSRGVLLGELLAERGIALAAWTLVDDGPVRTTTLLESLFAAGVTVVITEYAAEIASYAHHLALQPSH